MSVLLVSAQAHLSACAISSKLVVIVLVLTTLCRFFVVSVVVLLTLVVECLLVSVALPLSKLVWCGVVVASPLLCCCLLALASLCS